jgi:hypothetical protein
MSVIGHLVGTLVRTIFKVLLAIIVGGAAGAGVTLAVAHSQTQQWAPQGLTLAATIAIGALSAACCGLLVLMGAAIRGLLATGKLAVKEATSPAGLALEAVRVMEHAEKR